MNTYTTEEARAKLGDVILNAQAGVPTLITYHGVPGAVVVSHQWWSEAHRLIGDHIRAVQDHDAVIGHSKG